jgi:phage-related protein
MIITSINLSGLDLVSDDYWFQLSGLHDIEKDVVTSDLFTDGEEYGHSKNKPKTLVLNGWVQSDDDAKMFALNRILGSNGLKPIIINGTYLGYVEISNRIGNADNSHVISCQLTIPDPYWYALTPSIITLGSTSNAGKTYPYTYPRTYGSITGGEGVITNIGNATAYPVITVVGTCDTITVANKTTGESMSVAVSLAESDILVIDCTPNNRGIYLNGVPRMDLKNGDWISCLPGDNNITFARNSLENKQHCTISLQSRSI